MAVKPEYNKLFKWSDMRAFPEHQAPYMWRFSLLRTPWGRLYLHKFVGNDWAPDPHDHPTDFISIGIWGRYKEWAYMETVDGLKVKWLGLFQAPWIRRFPAEHIHRLEMLEGDGPCYTICWVSKPNRRKWGFYIGTVWIEALEYVRYYGTKVLGLPSAQSDSGEGTDPAGREAEPGCQTGEPSLPDQS